MSSAGFRFGSERGYPLAQAGPDARFTESLIDSVAGVLVGYGSPRLASLKDSAGLKSALTAFLYSSQERSK
ncbi:hypothetical protein [Streptomyces sp. bgisy027]|uniref:hypothetical protein n=1 Tax=Streptomyces sp. bgisy027 TaxID=3413770 RepID=UPI003D759E4F